MNTEDLLVSFKKAVCDAVEIVPRGNKYVVQVPFTFADGDHYVVMLAQEGDRWVLTDAGHTFMHLSYTQPDFARAIAGRSCRAC